MSGFLELLSVPFWQFILQLAGADTLHWKCSQPESLQLLQKHMGSEIPEELE